ncbi:MAG TPA: dihydrolipoamide acetyltransferase family protein [Prolixibacteraceae bacterium]|nr:dihydrolipoamide acetyltransferase family protein [Prolixibacteraceae bacterium]
MATAVIMPRQGQSVETCLLGQWFKEIGDEVKTGDLLFSYETDKASFEEEAKADGYLLARYFESGDEVPVLAEVGVIGEKGEMAVSRTETADSPAPAVEQEEQAKVIEFQVEQSVQVSGRIRISPLARNMAARMGVDLAGLKGTGPQGRIIARDVEKASLVRGRGIREQGAGIPEKLVTEQERQPAGSPRALPGNGPAKGTDFEVKPLTNIRKLIAKAMHASLQNSAQLTHHLSADARNILAIRKNFKKDFESGKIRENVTINDLVCYAVIRALKEHPQVNTHFLADRIKYFSKVHLGLAVDTDRGLMVTALQNADDLSVTGLSSRLQQLAADCRKGSINPDLLSPEAATFTVSNLGNYGVEMFTPIINLPQTAILGVCAILPRPKELGDGVYAFVPHMGLSLTYDHRALDGGEATRFLAAVRSQIENLTLLTQ